MNMWQKIQNSFRALFRKEKLDREMDDEMRFHLDMRTRSNLEAGTAGERSCCTLEATAQNSAAHPGSRFQGGFANG